MVECQMCDCELNEYNMLYECPYCGEPMEEDELWRCENCDAVVDRDGDEWVCPYCSNEGNDEEEEEIERMVIFDDVDECPECGGDMYDDCCDECGYPDVNQGWVGEHYG